MQTVRLRDRFTRRDPGRSLTVFEFAILLLVVGCIARRYQLVAGDAVATVAFAALAAHYFAGGYYFAAGLTVAVMLGDIYMQIRRAERDRAAECDGCYLDDDDDDEPDDDNLPNGPPDDGRPAYRERVGEPSLN